MLEAVAEARKALGLTHPNPAVGAVIVHQGERVARGYTRPAGQEHAEIVALREFDERGIRPDASTVLVVTMEPCSTTGRTGACTEAIAASGIRKVVIGTRDPNPAHCGRGIGILRSAGIEVHSGILEDECEDLNLVFNWRMERGEPLIAAKVATTLDGRIATRGGLSKWITNAVSRQHVHSLRKYYPAIAVGAGTVLADDPSLTVRIDGLEESCPIRFVFDRNLVTFKEQLPRLYTDRWREKTIVVTSRARKPQVVELEQEHGVRFWTLENAAGAEELSEFVRRCEDHDIGGLLVEGGAHLLSEFLKCRYIHYLYAYRSPKLLGDTSGLAPFIGQEPLSMEETIRLEKVRHATFGDDQLMRGFVVYPD